MKRLVVVALFASAVGCGGSSPPVVFGGAVQPQRGHYDDMLHRYTRHVHATHLFDTAIDADITLMSPEFRSHYIEKVDDLRRLSSAEKAKLEADQATESQLYVEFVVRMRTSAWNWNDLTSRDRSLWTVTLADDRGRTFGPPDVQYVTLKDKAIEELFPPETPFTRAYRIRFPRTLPDGSKVADENTRWLELRIAGPLAQTAARWESK